MKRSVLCLLLLMLLVGPALSDAQKDSAGPQKSKAQKSKTFVDRVLEFLAISYTPGAQKSPVDEMSSGEVWVTDLTTHFTRALTSAGEYRSPVFLAGKGDVLALRGNDVVRIPVTGGDGTKLYSASGIIKLVGVGAQDSGKVLVLLKNPAGSHPQVGLLAIDTGAITNLPYDPGSSQDLQLIEDLEGSSREYGDKRVWVESQSKETVAGTIEWSDVFLVLSGQQRVNVSHCDGRNCGQPSLSQDGNSLVYIKEKE